MESRSKNQLDELIVQDSLRHSLFSWNPQGNLQPINAHRAKGVYIYDREGKSYLDFSSQLMNVNIGHGHPRILEAVTKQMQELSYVYPGMATKVRAELSRKLAEISPPKLNKTFFTIGGAEAIENAIKIARVYSGRPKILSLYRSYHGATYGAMAASGDPRKHPIESQIPPHFIHVENPYSYRCPWHSSNEIECGERAAAHMEQIIQYENPSSIAAILIEGESGSSGCMKYPPNYWTLVKEIADRYGILIIDDEVMSGFGRTGKMFAVERFGVEPDIICIAKGLTSGYIPLGGIMVSDEIAAAFDHQPLPLGLTCSAHPVSCAAALAVINVIEEDKLVERAAYMGQYIEAGVEKLKAKHPSIGDFRNTGLLGCIELVKNRKTKEPLVPWNASGDKLIPTQRMAAKIKELGMFTFVRWNFIFIAPPLCISKTEVDEGLEIVSQAVAIADEYCT